jgi:simple sugar transport system ATP-binding protein
MTASQATNGSGKAPLLEIDHVSKYFGNVIALKDVSAVVNEGEVTCVLGDNGAGKSTFIKILSGVHHEDEGEIRMDGDKVSFGSPRAAKERGIATVFQDLATVPLMSIWRNVRDPDQPVGTLSGGERQAVAIARAMYFGAKVLILDEPTSALGVKQSGIVLRYIVHARERGVGVIFISHNPHHAYPVGDRFVILNRGKLQGSWKRGDISRDELVQLMAGGAELDQLTHELRREMGQTTE